jgi:hypothetical protein
MGRLIFFFFLGVARGLYRSTPMGRLIFFFFFQRVSRGGVRFFGSSWRVLCKGVRYKSFGRTVVRNGCG